MPAFTSFTTATLPAGSVTLTGGASGSFGSKLGGVGDINNDGYADFIVMSPHANIGVNDTGALYLVFGGPALGTSIDVSALNGTNGFLISGLVDMTLAESISGIGDFNGDGFGDMVLGDLEANGAFVIFGAASFTSTLSVADLDGTNGFFLAGVAADEWAGEAVSGIGDINNDGLDDFAIGGRFTATDGSVYVVFGREGPFDAAGSLADLDGTNGFRVDGLGDLDGLGQAVSGGDINGDGLSDLVMTAPTTSVDGMISAGAVYVLYGKETAFDAVLTVDSITGATGATILGDTVSDWLGRTADVIGDFNGDGYDDIVLGSVNGGADGAVWVVFGGPTMINSITELDGTNGFRMLSAAGGIIGRTVSGGDINGDGFADIVMGDQNADPSGLVYVIFGRASGLPATLDLVNLAPTDGFTFGGSGAALGSGAAAIGDVNGDGLDDFMAGGINVRPGGGAFLIYGMQADLTLVGSGAVDTLEGKSGADTLSGLDGKDLLYGLAGDDSLDGGLGGDLLDGGTGADAMVGGAGDDTYIVDDLGDTATEGADEGADRVRASVTFTLGDNLDNLTLEGAGDINGTGNALANVLDGNSGANTLSGASGNDLIKGHLGDDTLNGDAGVDQLLGGDGADILDGGADNDRIDGGAGADDLVGGGGNDLLDGGADNDSLSGDAGADQLLGGDGADILDGGSENDVLNGGTGADAMTGGTGDDTYFVDDAGDTTIEAGGQGVDQVRASLSHTLAANIETLILQGAGNLNGTGNALANTLNGNTGDNQLSGADGNDTLKGGGGADTLTGGIGADILVGGAGADRFVVLQESVYSSLAPGGRVLEVDTVSDYAIGQDIIDLSAIDAVAGGADSAFVLVGAFSGAAGQMTLTFAGGTTTLSLDVDGDRKADYMMKINGDVRADSGTWLL
jgi:Ca2+-binding RTX toxin-like protein